MADSKSNLQCLFERPRKPSKFVLKMVYGISCLLFLAGLAIAVAGPNWVEGLILSFFSILFYSRWLAIYRYWFLINWIRDNFDMMEIKGKLNYRKNEVMPSMDSDDME